MSIKLMLMSKYKTVWSPKAQTAPAPNPAQAVLLLWPHLRKLRLYVSSFKLQLSPWSLPFCNLSQVNELPYFPELAVPGKVCILRYIS